MNNVEKLKHIIKSEFEDVSLIIANDWQDADRLLTKAKLPAILMTVPVQGSTEWRNRRRYHTDNVLLAFADLVPKDSNSRENLHTHSKMRELADLVVKEINRSNVFEPITKTEYKTFINRGSDIVSGVFVSIQLVSLIGDC